jgi:aminoglycoside 6'-N-acetyltransferase I
MTSRYGLEIRAATQADAAGLAELFAASGHPTTSGELADRLAALKQDSGAVLLALEWGPPSGVVAVAWHRRLEAPHPVAQIITLLVGPDNRRRGIGRLLVKAAAQAARSAGCNQIELLATDDSLQAFGTASGFSPGGARLIRGLRKK